MAPQQTEVDEPTIGKLVGDASKDISSLISKEIQLAKSELKVSVKAGGIGIAMFVGAGFTAVLGIIMFSVTLAYLINWDGDGLSLKWSFLIVTVFWFLVAGLLAMIGIKKVKQVGPPEKAIGQGKQIPAALKGSGKKGSAKESAAKKKADALAPPSFEDELR